MCVSSFAELKVSPWFSFEAGFGAGIGNGAETETIEDRSSQVASMTAYAGIGVIQLYSLDVFFIVGWDYLKHSSGNIFAEASSIKTGLQLDIWNTPTDVAYSIVAEHGWIVYSEYNYERSRESFYDESYISISTGIRVWIQKSFFFYPNIKSYSTIAGEEFKFLHPVVFGIEFGMLYF